MHTSGEVLTIRYLRGQVQSSWVFGKLEAGRASYLGSWSPREVVEEAGMVVRQSVSSKSFMAKDGGRQGAEGAAVILQVDGVDF